MKKLTEPNYMRRQSYCPNQNAIKLILFYCLLRNIHLEERFYASILMSFLEFFYKYLEVGYKNDDLSDIRVFLVNL